MQEREKKLQNAMSQSEGRHALTGPGQYELANPLPEGGRFNKHKSKTVFEIQIIPTRDIPGPGTYENLRQVLPMRSFGLNVQKAVLKLVFVIIASGIILTAMLEW